MIIIIVVLIIAVIIITFIYPTYRPRMNETCVSKLEVVRQLQKYGAAFILSQKVNFIL